jgi:penicillin amidase
MQWSPIRPGGMVSDLLSLEAPTPGDPFTLMSTVFASDDARPFVSNAGTNFQAVMSLSDESGSYFITPAGQSGHPLSKFYENLFPKWMQGEYIMMSTVLNVTEN